MSDNNGISNDMDSKGELVTATSGKKSKVKKGEVLVRPETAQQLSGDLNTLELLRVLTEVKNGNFSVRMPIDQVGITGKIFDALNDVITMNERMMEEFTNAGNTIGKQGKLSQRIELPNAKANGAPGLNPSIRLSPISYTRQLKLLMLSAP